MTRIVKLKNFERKWTVYENSWHVCSEIVPWHGNAWQKESVENFGEDL